MTPIVQSVRVPPSLRARRREKQKTKRHWREKVINSLADASLSSARLQKTLGFFQ